MTNGNYKHIIILFISYISAYSQNKSNTINYLDSLGLRQGVWEFYNEKGILINKSEFQDDQLHGRCKLFWSNGQLRSESMYRFNNPWQSISCYDSLGNELDPGTLRDGTGRIKSYYNNGMLEIEEIYSTGSPYIIWHMYHENGKLWQEGLLVDSKISIEKRTIINNKEVFQVTFINLPKKDGLWSYYNTEGILFKEEIYIKDELLETRILK